MASRSYAAVLFAALFIAATTMSVSQAQAPDADEWLTAHNVARTAEGVGLPPLTWNSSAYLFALSWAQNQAPASCYGHSGSTTYGENIYWSSLTITPPTAAVVSWVAEKVNYTYSSNSCVDGQTCLHYTQVVWKETTSVGCASALCSTGGKFFICDYYPPGNVGGGPPY